MTKIVFIDSENTVRELYSHLLEAAGYRVFQATTAQYGMWLCEECEPDLIITSRNPVDAELEHGYFIDVLRGKAGRTPVVIVSHAKPAEATSLDGTDSPAEPSRYLELMNAIHCALDDGLGEVTISSGRIAEVAASSTRP